MKLITDSDPDIINLKVPTEQFDFDNPPADPMNLARDMIQLMYDLNGIGLAANQVGIPYRLFVMRGTKDNGDFACFNPKIVHFSNEEILLEESCLSYPGLIVKIKRPRHVRVRFTLPDHNTLTQQFTGMTARCVQHELDHLNGELFFNRAAKYHRDFGFRNRNKNAKMATKPLEISPFDYQHIA